MKQENLPEIEQLFKNYNNGNGMQIQRNGCCKSSIQLITMGESNCD